MDTSFNVGFLCGDASRSDLSRFENITFQNCSLRAERVNTATQINVSVGEGTYYGVFGLVAEGASFEPAQGSEEISVEIV